MKDLVKTDQLKTDIAAFLKSGLLPRDVNTPEKAFLIASKGGELGLPPLVSFSHINVIQGKPTVSSELMLALIFKNCRTAQVSYPKHSAKECEISVRRDKDTPWSTFSFTIEEAKAAGLTGKDNWKKYPSAMLRARAIAIAARAVFPDAVLGCSYTPDELGDSEWTPEGEIEVDCSVAAAREIEALPAKDVSKEKAESKRVVAESLIDTATIPWGKNKGVKYKDIPLKEVENTKAELVKYVTTKKFKGLNEEVQRGLNDYIETTNKYLEAVNGAKA